MIAIQPNLCTDETGRSNRLVLTAVLVALGVTLVSSVRSVHRVAVEGGSMAPALLSGDRLLVFKWPQWWRQLFYRHDPGLKPGEVVAVRDPRDPSRVLVKRVSSVDRYDRTLLVLGDASEASTDSRTFGPVPWSLVLGRAIYRYAPPGRTGHSPWTAEYHRQ